MEISHACCHHANDLNNLEYLIASFTVGEPIEVPKVEKPGSGEVEKYHTLYMEKLSELFNQHKTKYGVDPDKYLRFV